MGVVAANPASQFEEHRRAVFVGGDGSAEGEKPEVLEDVV